MSRRLLWLPALAVLLLAALALPLTTASAKPWIGVDGNRLVDQRGNTVRLLGVNRSGFEYSCVDEGELIEGPTDRASIEAMKRWKINSVRLPLNETCWLGINGLSPQLSGAAYRAAVHAYVTALERAGLYVILDLHWSAPGTNLGTGLLPLAAADHAPEFWRSVATEFRDDRSVIFDLFNEPHDIDWDCWANSCRVRDAYFGEYQVSSMPELLNAVRSTGARQPVMLGGLEWASELRGFLEYVPADPAEAIVASNHSYWGVTTCAQACRRTLVNIARHYPVITGEIGQMGCRHGYVDGYLRWADRHGISYLGWTWNTGGRWDCSGGPSLIRDWSGQPTAYGKGLKKHLQRLAKQRRN